MIVVVAAMIVAGSRSQKPARKSTAGTPASLPAQELASPIIQIREYAQLPRDSFYSALRRDLGDAAKVEPAGPGDREVGFVALPGGHMEVYEPGGRIDTINIFFNEPQANWLVALHLIGLDGAGRRPGKTPPAFYSWTNVFEGISEVRAYREPPGGTKVRGVGITP